MEDMRSELLDSGLDPAFHTPEEIAFALFETDVPPPSLALRLGSPLIPLPAKRGRSAGGRVVAARHLMQVRALRVGWAWPWIMALPHAHRPALLRSEAGRADGVRR